MFSFFLALEDEVEEETEDTSGLLHSGGEEHVKANVIEVAQGLQVLGDRLTHLELMCRLLQVLRLQILHVNEVILFVKHL